jgi:Domain of unknown function (DUF4272)
VESDEDLVPVADYSKLYARSAREVATRAIVLQGIVAIACDVEAEPIVKWFKEQGIWGNVTKKERKFILSGNPSEPQQIQCRWKQEAEWTLLWMIGKVESLGLPTRCCDTRRLVDEIIPALGSDISDFVGGAKLRSPGALLAEDDRTYNLWCYALAAQRTGQALPTDLNLGVLRERRYAFEWMDGNQEWDDVTCDA